MKKLSLLALSLVMVLSLAACGGNRGANTNGGTTNGTTNGATNGTTNGATNGTTNGATNGTTNGTTNGATGGTVNGTPNGTAGGVNGSGAIENDGANRDAIGGDLDDMVRDGLVDDKDGNLNRQP